MSTIELFFGNVATRGAGAMTVVPLYKRNAQFKQQPISMAVKDDRSGVKTLGVVDVKNSSSNGRPGQWVKTRVEIPEGSFIEFQFMISGKKSWTENGLRAMVIRAREDGPLHSVHVELPYDEAVSDSKNYIVGRFDILSPAEIVSLGIACDKNEDAYDPDEYENFITLEVLEREFRAKPRAAIKTLVKPASSASSGDAKNVAAGKSVLKVRRLRRIGS